MVCEHKHKQSEENEYGASASSTESGSLRVKSTCLDSSYRRRKNSRNHGTLVRSLGFDLVPTIAPSMAPCSCIRIRIRIGIMYHVSCVQYPCLFGIHLVIVQAHIFQVSVSCLCSSVLGRVFHVLVYGSPHVHHTYYP